MKPRLRRGLYAVTDARLGDQLLQAVSAAIRGGAVAVQYREKSSEKRRREREAGSLLALCRQAGIPLIVNDDVALAGRIGADGVHLGADDTSLALAREALGDSAIIGASCYNRLELALEAEAAGADYVAFGSFFPSPTKPAAVRAQLALLQEGRDRLTVPMVAIGGITAQNGGTLVTAGADMLAALSSLFGAEDVEATARRLWRCFDETSAQVTAQA